MANQNALSKKVGNPLSRKNRPSEYRRWRSPARVLSIQPFAALTGLAQLEQLLALGEKLTLVMDAEGRRCGRCSLGLPPARARDGVSQYVKGRVPGPRDGGDSGRDLPEVLWSGPALPRR